MQSVMAALPSLAAAAHHRFRAFKLLSLVPVQTSHARSLVACCCPRLRCLKWLVALRASVLCAMAALRGLATVAHRRCRTFNLLLLMPLLLPPPSPLLLLLRLLLLSVVAVSRVTHLALHLHTVRAP